MSCTCSREPWGYMTDELYYLDSIDRLDWGFVDHPPLSIALLGGVRALIGDSLLGTVSIGPREKGRSERGVSNAIEMSPVPDHSAAAAKPAE